MDMGPKEWSRFGDDVWKYAQQLKTGEIPSKISDTRTILVISGYPGSGRQAFVDELKNGERKWLFVEKNVSNEDGREFLAAHLKKNVDICINKPNVTQNQRKIWYPPFSFDCSI